MLQRLRAAQVQVAGTSFLALFSIVGFALYGLPYYYSLWVEEFGWSRTQVTSGNALSKLLIGPLFGFIAGWVVDRFGPRRLMLAGILMAGGALIGLGSMSALWMFYLFYLFNALGYVCGGPLPNQVLLSRWFDKARGKAMGFAYLGIGIGGAVVPQLSRWLNESLGWRGGLRVLGILMIVLALPMAYFVKESPDERAEKQNAAAPIVPLGGIFRTRAFYLLALGSMCSIGAVGGANQHLKLFLSKDHSYSEGGAANVMSLVLAFSIIGRLLMGWLADRWPKKYVMLMIYLLVAAAIPLLFFAATPGAMYLFAAIFGLGLGGEYLIIPLMAAELFGVKVMGRLMGVVLTADGVAEALSPMLIGYLRDRTGSYRTGFMTLIGIAMLGAMAVACLSRKELRASSEIAATAKPAGAD
ncbi:MAG TPA: MFS transporter [Blastocatellia bacterium]|nr:MFS transporter [Blastocatellia bacterium]